MPSPSDQAVVLEAQAVFRTLGQTEVLRGISLQVKAGEFVAITGPSGSGKTTLLYLLGALDTPSQGEIRVDQVAISSLNDTERSRLRQRSIGFVFQFHFLLPELTALENVAIPAMLSGLNRSDAESRARALLERVQLSHRLTHRPGELSGGEQQRVAIARALINQPRLILADEPTGNLDSENTERVFALLQELNREQNLAVVLVTHNEELASRCHREIRMLDGRVVAEEGL
jgi:lipoprotein-releasing system ATP-binding protein